MSRAAQRGVTLTETLAGMALLAYVSIMFLQIVASASSVDIKLRARTEAWQTMNAVAAPAQYVDCTQLHPQSDPSDAPQPLRVCKPDMLLGYSAVRDTPLNDQEYTHTGQFGIYTISLDDSSDQQVSGEDVPTRTVTIEWRPDGSPSEIIEHTVFGPWGGT